MRGMKVKRIIFLLKPMGRQHSSSQTTMKSQKSAEDLERITSPYGIQLRVNRSIQAEGSFASVKQDSICLTERNSINFDNSKIKKKSEAFFKESLGKCAQNQQ